LLGYLSGVYYTAGRGKCKGEFSSAGENPGTFRQAPEKRRKKVFFFRRLTSIDNPTRVWYNYFD
jgi:hypothetical protein